MICSIFAFLVLVPFGAFSADCGGGRSWMSSFQRLLFTRKWCRNGGNDSSYKSIFEQLGVATYLNIQGYTAVQMFDTGCRSEVDECFENNVDPNEFEQDKCEMVFPNMCNDGEWAWSSNFGEQYDYSCYNAGAIGRKERYGCLCLWSTGCPGFLSQESSDSAVSAQENAESAVSRPVQENNRLTRIHEENAESAVSQENNRLKAANKVLRSALAALSEN